MTSVPFFLVTRDVRVRVLRGTTASWLEACTIGVAWGTLAGLLNLATGLLLSALHVHSPHRHSALPPIVFELFACTAAPVLEELVFQGWLQTRLNRFGKWPSALVTTAAFTLFHLPLSPMMGTRVLGLGTLAILRLKTASLLTCMIAHAATNVFVFTVPTLLIATGLGGRFLHDSTYVTAAYARAKTLPCAPALAGNWHGFYIQSEQRHALTLTVAADGCSGKSDETRYVFMRGMTHFPADLLVRVDPPASRGRVIILKRYDGSAGVSSSAIYSGRVRADRREITGAWTTELDRDAFAVAR